MKKYIRNIVILIIFLITILFITKVQALTIIETTKEDEFDTIKSNSIIIGITKFEPNEVLTAGKSSLATFNDAKFNKENENYTAPKIYYYLQGSWMEIDIDNNAKVIEDTNLIEDLNTQDIYFVNNNEKILEAETVGQVVEEGYELVFETNNTAKDKEIKYEGKKVFIPATLNTVKVLSKKQVLENK